MPLFDPNIFHGPQPFDTGALNCTLAVTEAPDTCELRMTRRRIVNGSDLSRPLSLKRPLPATGMVLEARELPDAAVFSASAVPISFAALRARELPDTCAMVMEQDDTDDFVAAMMLVNEYEELAA